MHAALIALLALCAQGAPLPALYLRTEYLVNPTLIDTPAPRLSWTLQASAGERGVVQSAFQILVQSKISGQTVWNSGIVNSSQQNQVLYQGSPLAPGTTYSWTVTWFNGAGQAAPPSAPAYWGTSPGDDAAWNAVGSQWIGCGSAPSANMLRYDFTATPSTPGLTLTRATLYVSGLGWHRTYVNGQRVSRSVLEPAFTHLRLRVLYTAHDVTALLNSSGSNTIASYLGKGWPGQFEPWSSGMGEPKWNGTGSPATAIAQAQVTTTLEQKRNPLAGITQEGLDELLRKGYGHGTSGYERRLRVWMSLQWSDGSMTHVVTSASDLGADSGASSGATATWQCGRGPLLSDDIYAGVSYDARLEMPGWNSPGFNASGWVDAVRIAEPGGAMAPAVAQPVEVSAEIIPCALWESTPNVWVYDFCQNFAGVVRLTLPGPTLPGTLIEIRHAEAVMHPPYGPKDGTLYYGNLRSAEATDTYITRGDTNGEVWEPMFTWHGFRYISIEGLTGAPTLTGGLVLGIHFHSATPAVGSLAFPASANTLNQLQHAIVWSQASNILGNPSDCPQRDERMGWTGDAALVAEEFALNFDASAFLTQWSTTLNDAMHNTVDPTYVAGLLPAQVPDMTGGYHSDSSWSSVWPTTLYTLWKAYGDTRAVSNFWGDLVLYIDTTVGEMGKGGIAHIPAGLGDWCPPGAAPGQDQGPKPDSEFSGGATFLVDLQHVIEMGVALGSPDVPRLQTLWGTLAAQFNAAWAHNGWYGSSPTDGAQCAQAQAIAAGVVPPANLSTIAAYLVADIAAHDTHLSVGIIGEKYLTRALTATNNSDVAIDIMLQTTYPSFGWQFTHPDEPSTTLWELWNAPSEGPGMNSRAHVMHASVGAWLYTDVAGISQAPESSGYESLLLWPRATTHPSLPFASGSIETIRGKVALAWEAASNTSTTFSATATLPPNTGGEVRLPFPPGTPTTSLVLTDGAPPVTCAANAAENAPFTFSCPPGGLISAVAFASFGNPTGSCATGFTQGSCHAPTSTSVLEAACLGQNSCTISVDVNTFGDPCQGEVKHLDAQVVCNGGGGGSVVIFSNGTYQPGVSGVTGAWVNASMSTLSVAVGSGTYNLALSW